VTNNGGYFNDLDAEDIINGVRKAQSGEYGEDGNGDNGQNTDNVKGKKKGGKYKYTITNAIDDLYFIFRFIQALLNENVNGIPAKEIKLAKILMDKPAPHCSA
jgi:hypothetical protein